MKKNLFFGALFATVLLASCDSKEEGTINGLFSVSETQQVKFSSGNLQYTKSTKTFQFAEYQWNVIGDLDQDFDEKDTFDLFAWGSGDNPRPEELEEEEGATFVDWGTQSIANGGDYKWRTLTNTEWDYLIRKRPNALNLLAYGTIENTKGIILLPDAWEQPEGVQFVSLVDTVVVTYSSMNVKNWTKETDLTPLNTYDAATWQKMEDAGAVFLPYNMKVFSSDEQLGEGQYWSNTDSEMNFSNNFIWPDRGCSIDAFVMGVRLVKDVVKE